MTPRDVALGVLVFAATLAISLAIVGFVLTRLPSNYFTAEAVVAWAHLPAWQRTTARVGKNLLGVILVVVGFALSIPGVPGQGILTILIGIILVDFPGKRRFERRIVGMPRVLLTCNRLRARFGRAPFVPPPPRPSELSGR